MIQSACLRPLLNTCNLSTQNQEQGFRTNWPVDRTYCHLFSAGNGAVWAPDHFLGITLIISIKTLQWSRQGFLSNGHPHWSLASLQRPAAKWVWLMNLAPSFPSFPTSAVLASFLPIFPASTKATALEEVVALLDTQLTFIP